MEQVAPGFGASVLHRQVIGPHQMQEEYGLVGGNIFHGELTIGQMFHARPAAGYADLRTPLRGLYQAGSSTHGGGGVTGIPGRNVVRQVLADRRSARWRRAAPGRLGSARRGQGPRGSSPPSRSSSPRTARLARRSPGLTAPRMRAPATHASPPLTTERRQREQLRDHPRLDVAKRRRGRHLRQVQARNAAAQLVGRVVLQERVPQDFGDEVGHPREREEPQRDDQARAETEADEGGAP